MKISVISPVKNEAPWIGYSVLSVLPFVHEFVYTCAESNDGTDELLAYIKERYAGDKLRILRKPSYDWNPHDVPAYNASYNDCIDAATGDAVWFLHADMIVTNPEAIEKMDPTALAWVTNLQCYAGDFNTKIVNGRAYQWKNIYAKKFGLHYYGGYGSDNEDFYFKDITGKQYIHHNGNWKAYPYKVSDSGLNVNHYCEVKSYKRRYEKMKLCLKTIFPKWTDEHIAEMAAQHPRVTLEPSTDLFGNFAFEKTGEPLPEVVQRHKTEFEEVIKGRVLA